MDRAALTPGILDYVKNNLDYSQLPNEPLSVPQRWVSLAEFALGSVRPQGLLSVISGTCGFNRAFPSRTHPKWGSRQERSNSSAPATEPQNQMEKRDGFAENHEDYP